MYQPLFNTVVVEINDKDAEWGNGNDDSMLGKSFRLGKVVSIGLLIPDHSHPTDQLSPASLGLFQDTLMATIGEEVMWNEGVEAGTIFEDEGKQYAMIYWWDLRGTKK
jgi:hypothetical protein